MSRISALPVLRYCTGSALVDKQVEELEFSRTIRGTVFHHYCETGEWGEKYQLLSKDDQEEIQQWKVPSGVATEFGDGGRLEYAQAVKEYRVKFKHGPGDLEFIPGTLDMFWMTGDIAVAVDIKSNIRAVSDGIDSIQLHGYGHALLHEFPELKGYVQGIYSAMDGTWHMARKPVVRDSWEQMELEDTMCRAIRQPFAGYHIGTHCSGCWKRARCPAFLIETHDAPTFGRVISGAATAQEVREALIMRDRMKASLETIDDALKTWVTQNGPIPSEDGKKSWRPHLMPGRVGWDKRKVQALLDKSGAEEQDYMTQSAGYQVFSWKKAEKRA